MNLAALLLCIIPCPHEPVVDYCDRIELNHVYSRDGNPAFIQVILWSGGHVRAWRLKNECGPIESSPYGVRVFHRHGGSFREFRASSWSRSWTMYDVELHERQRRPVHERWGLTPEGEPK